MSCCFTCCCISAVCWASSFVSFRPCRTILGPFWVCTTWAVTHFNIVPGGCPDSIACSDTVPSVDAVVDGIWIVFTICWLVGVDMTVWTVCFTGVSWAVEVFTTTCCGWLVVFTRTCWPLMFITWNLEPCVSCWAMLPLFCTMICCCCCCGDSWIWNCICWVCWTGLVTVFSCCTCGELDWRMIFCPPIDTNCCGEDEFCGLCRIICCCWPWAFWMIIRFSPVCCCCCCGDATKSFWTPPGPLCTTIFWPGWTAPRWSNCWRFAEEITLFWTGCVMIWPEVVRIFCTAPVVDVTWLVDDVVGSSWV